MDLPQIARLLSAADTYAVPIGFALVTMYLQLMCRVFNAKTFGADLAAAATAMVVSAAVSKATGIAASGTVGPAVLVAAAFPVVWFTCLRLAAPDERRFALAAESPPTARHALSAFIGLLSLFLATWFVKQLLALGAATTQGA